MSIFNETQIILSERVTLNFLNIENYSKELISLIEREIGYIRNGDLSDEDIKDVKKRLRIWIESKKDNRAKNGFVAEFICHLYLRHIRFEQYSLFKNLEENRGVKKGFDGMYFFNDEMWVVESKSTEDINKTHQSKINDAYNDIKNRLETTEEDKVNDPWENALNHLDRRSMKYNESLLNNVKKLSTDFINNVKHNVEEYNIIPCSTIYMSDKWIFIDNEKLKTEIEIKIKEYNAKKLNILCVNKKSVDCFTEFIKA